MDPSVLEAAARKLHAADHNGDLLRQAAYALRLAQRDDATFRPMHEAPQDGTVIRVRTEEFYRFQLYRKGSQQLAKGIKGRWQVLNEYGGWENADLPFSEWAPAEDSAA